MKHIHTMTDLILLHGKENARKRFVSPRHYRKIYNVDQILEKKNFCLPAQQLPQTLTTNPNSTSSMVDLNLFVLKTVIEQKNQIIYLMFFLLALQTVLLLRNR